MIAVLGSDVHPSSAGLCLEEETRRSRLRGFLFRGEAWLVVNRRKRKGSAGPLNDEFLILEVEGWLCIQGPRRKEGFVGQPDFSNPSEQVSSIIASSVFVILLLLHQRSELEFKTTFEKATSSDQVGIC